MLGLELVLIVGLLTVEILGFLEVRLFELLVLSLVVLLLFILFVIVLELVVPGVLLIEPTEAQFVGLPLAVDLILNLDIIFFKLERFVVEFLFDTLIELVFDRLETVRLIIPLVILIEPLLTLVRWSRLLDTVSNLANPVQLYTKSLFEVSSLRYLLINS